MKLSLADRVALIYTSAGSQRNVAALLGISHQKVGRILRAGQEGGYAKTSRVLSDPGLIDAVNVGFEIHKDIVRSQARADKLPFIPEVPIYSARMEMDNGVLGDRVEAPNLHWVSDNLRDDFLRKTRKTGRYYAVSVGSVVNLVAYNRLANAINRGKFDDAEKLENARQILRDVIKGAADNETVDISQINYRDIPRQNDDRTDLERKAKNIGRAIGKTVIAGLIHTQYTPFQESGIPTQALIDDVNSKLRTKHAGAVGDPGTKYATRILFQVDTRYGKDKDFRDKHPIPTKSRKPRAVKKRSR